MNFLDTMRGNFGTYSSFIKVPSRHWKFQSCCEESLNSFNTTIYMLFFCMLIVLRGSLNSLEAYLEIVAQTISRCINTWSFINFEWVLENLIFACSIPFSLLPIDVVHTKSSVALHSIVYCS